MAVANGTAISPPVNGLKANMKLLDSTGKPFTSPKKSTEAELNSNREKALAIRLATAQYELRRYKDFKAKYDAAQTFTGNENHWANADHLDPHAVASLPVRRKLRSRSRYELIENNPYLKGTVLTIVNDFIGRGPDLEITDKRLSPDAQKAIVDKFMEWAKVINLRQKLWRMRMAKIVDGESFAIPYVNKNRKGYYDLLLDLYVVECDRISSQEIAGQQTSPDANVGEIDGVRFDVYENPLAYYLLSVHPGNGAIWPISSLYPKTPGKWIDARYMIHWFRQERGWLRGIPEAASSLPLCALLRRYTLSIVRHAEVLADFTVLLESEYPAGMGAPAWAGGSGQGLIDDPMDLFPLEMGMAMNLPFGMKANQLESVPLGVQYDQFVGSVLREITRPLLATYNVAAGTSKDSNMASAVVDQNIYKGGQESERRDCEAQVLCSIFKWWWAEAILTPNYLPSAIQLSDRIFTANRPPQHRWGWDNIGLDHTDPSKVAQALDLMHSKRHMTNADIQRRYFNRNVDEWQQEIQRDDKFWATVKPIDIEPKPPVAPSGGGSSPPKKQAPKGK